MWFRSRVNGKWKILVCLLVAGMLCGCKKEVESVIVVRDVPGYTMGETMIFAATERNRYTASYTEQVLDVELDESGLTLQAYIMDQVKKFMENMKLMNLLAEEKGIYLTSTETERIRELSKEYFFGLSPGDLKYMQVSKEDAERMYQEYHIANKLVDELTKDLNLEVSDNEAKVIILDIIRVGSEEEASIVYEKAMTEGTDFANLAKSASLDKEISRKVSRGQESKVFEEAAFSLLADQVCPPFLSGNSYYILKCVEDYDKEATRENKKLITEKRKTEAFEVIYERFLTEHPITLLEGVFDQVSLTEGQDCTTTNFFDLYHKYFP